MFAIYLIVFIKKTEDLIVIFVKIQKQVVKLLIIVLIVILIFVKIATNNIH
jgi:hypothetical protein